MHRCVLRSNGSLLNRDQILTSNTQLLDLHRIQLINDREASPILPQEIYQPQLAQNSHNMLSTLPNDNDAMDSTPERLHSHGQVCGMW